MRTRQAEMIQFDTSRFYEVFIPNYDEGPMQLNLHITPLLHIYELSYADGQVEAEPDEQEDDPHKEKEPGIG